MLTFGIAYIRDFFNQFGILGETFETSVPWDRILQVTSAVRERLWEECKRASGCRNALFSFSRNADLSHRGMYLFHHGFFLYWFGRSRTHISRNRECVAPGYLDHGGSLSHHHGVGKVRKAFLSQVHSANSMHVLRQAKHAMDPNNIFSAGNGVFGDSP